MPTPNVYHVSMGYIWPKNPTATFNGTLLTGGVLATNPASPSVSTLSSLNDDDQIQFFVYDLTTSGTTPTPASSWIAITPQGSDTNLFEQSVSTLNTGASLLTSGSLQSVYFQLTVPCFQIALSGQALTAVVEQNDSGASGPFSVILQISVTDGTNVGTYTSYDPTMIVNPG